MAGRALEMTSGRVDGHVRLTVAGELDLLTRDRLVDAAVAVMAAGQPLEIDLTPVSFIDSGGAAALNRCRREAAERRCTLSVRVPEGGHVHQLLEWTGLSGVLTMHLDAPPG